jgi:hypothetical protein
MPAIHRTAFLPIVLILSAALALPASAASPLSIGPKLVDTSVTYHVDFDGHFWNGEKRAFSDDVTFERKAGDTIRGTMVPHTAGAKPGETFSGRLADDGRIVDTTGGEHVIGFNSVAALAANAPADLHVGSAWKTQIATPTGPSSSVPIPFDVSVVSLGGGRAVLQALAVYTTKTSYGGYDVPLDFTIKIAASFQDGAFARADYAASEVVHAGPQTQTLGWTWSLHSR